MQIKKNARLIPGLDSHMLQRAEQNIFWIKNNSVNIYLHLCFMIFSGTQSYFHSILFLFIIFIFFLHTMKVIEADISTEEIHTSLEQHKCQ